MKKKIILVLLAVCASCAAMAENIKRPNSYNYQRGCEAVNDGNYDEGMRFLQMELQDNPKNGYAWAWILSVHLNKQEYGKAIDAGNRSLKLLPKKDSYYIGFVHKSLSRVYYFMDDKDKALAEITAAIKADPSEADYHAMRGDLYYYAGKYDLADADFQKVVEKSPGETIGYMGIGRDLLANREYARAAEEFSYALKLKEDLSQAYAFRADCHIGTKDFRSAAQDLVRALEIDGNDRAFSTMADCNDTCYQAMGMLMKIKASKPANETDWNYYLGILHHQHDHYQDAIEYYKKSFETEPTAVASEYIARCYGELGNYPLAHKYVDIALELDSTDNDLIREKADYYYYTGETEKAIKLLDKYIEAVPEYYYGYYRRGFFKDNLHDVDGAIEDYTYSIMLEPQFTYAYLGRGDMYRLKGDEKAAMGDYQIVLAQDSIIKEQGNCRQYAYLMLGHRDSADVYMQRILEKYPTAGNYYDAACLMSRMGDTARSTENLRKAFEKGYIEFGHLEQDDDLDGIRKDPEYILLVETYKKRLKEKNAATGEDISQAVELETTEIPFSKAGSMMMIQCSINNLPLHFIFDTGASDVSISEVEANFMLKNGYLHKDDIVGKARYQTADGSISEGTVINLKHVSFGGLELSDVKASVVKNQKAPLLLGQSVFGKLGKIEIDNAGKVVKVTYMKKKGKV